MGDAAFLILAIEPTTGLLIFSISIVAGSLSGYIIDFMHGSNFMQNNVNIEIEFKKIKKTFVSNLNYLWLLIFFPGFIIGLFSAFQIDFDRLLNLDNKASASPATLPAIAGFFLLSTCT